jgi:small-conductance mechanosensitive channel
VAIVTVAFFIGIDLVGIDLTALAVFSGAFGLAVGFGLQKTFGNLIAGIILLMDRSIKPGDVIVVGDSFGHVTKIGVRAVSIVTRDGKEHLIPNENLMTQEVENWSYSSRDVRVHIPVGIAYDCDLPKAQQLMIEAAKASKRVLQSPEPRVWLRAFGESSVDHEILVWISDPEGGVGNVQSEILNRLWVLFQENAISIPFPQRDIRIKEMPAGVAVPPSTRD